MSILIGRDTRLVVQGITGREGEFHSRAMLEYGTTIVSGVTPACARATASGAVALRIRASGVVARSPREPEPSATSTSAGTAAAIAGPKVLPSEA